MKKVVSLCLSVLLMLSAMILPLSVSAEEYYFEDNSQNKYASLKDAIAGVSDGGTITMLADYTMPATDLGIDITKSVTIDGANHILTSAGTSPNAGYMMNIKVGEGKSVTFQNMTWNAYRGFYFYPKGSNVTVTAKNVTATMTGGCFFNLNNDQSDYKTACTGTVINVQSCNITEKKSNEPALLVQNDDTTTLNVTDSIVKTDCGMGTATSNNTCIRVKATGAKTTINLSNSTLISAYTGNSTAVASCLAIAAETHDIEVKLDEKTTFCFDGTMSQKNQFVQIVTGSKYTRTINDNGVTYQATKEIVGFGIQLPTVILTGGAPMLGWTVNGTTTVPAGTYTNATAEGTTTFKAIGVKSEEFYMVDGAAIRLEGPVGIRFKSRISENLLNTIAGMGASVTLTTYFAPTAKLATQSFAELLQTGTEGTDYVKVEKNQWANVELTGEKQFNAVISNIPEDAVGYQTAISAITALTVTYADSTTQTFFTVYDSAKNSRTMLQIAQSAISGGEGTTYMQGVVNACS